VDPTLTKHGRLAEDRTLDAEIAEAATLAADDVLLTELLATLAGVPDAIRLLARISVYCQPVDPYGLLYQIGEPNPAAELSGSSDTARCTATQRRVARAAREEALVLRPTPSVEAGLRAVTAKAARGLPTEVTI
jgi:hypothetical protein